MTDEPSMVPPARRRRTLLAGALGAVALAVAIPGAAALAGGGSGAADPAPSGITPIQDDGGRDHRDGRDCPGRDGGGGGGSSTSVDGGGLPV